LRHENEPVTLASIAEAVGVHVSTVSRVLRSQTPRTDTAIRIVETARDLGYTPHRAAASLRTRNSKLIGVLLPRLTDYVPARIYEGVDDAASTAGYTTVIAKSGDDPSHRLDRLEALLALRVDGVIVCDARLRDDQVVEELRRRGVPCILASRRVRGQVSATTNDLRGGALAAEHLVGLGHERIGVVAGPQHLSTGLERLQGFAAELKKRGLPLPDRLVAPSDFDVNAALVSARHLLTLDTGLTAIFAANDEAAVGVMGALREHGLRVGADVAVVGYNDLPFSAYLPVPLTSVSSPMYEVGRAAAELLIRKLHGDDQLKSVRLAPHLVARQSTKR
jgi:LacI family transcriptional regulator, galactose operon repressor